MKKPLTWDQRVDRATRRYDRLWDRASAMYGGEREKPKFYLVDRQTNPIPGAYASADPNIGVSLTKRLINQLGRRQVNRRTRMRNFGARGTLLHEWAHMFQKPDVLGDPHLREEGALVFERNGMRELFPKQYRRLGRRGYYSGHVPRTQTKDWYRTGQFT